MGWRFSTPGALAAAALVLAACGPSPKLALEISSPNETAYTNGAITIQVATWGDRPEKVELLRNGEVLARIAPPFQYTWDTTADAEGQYEITARAFKKGETFETTEPRIIVVDRTPPVIATRTPEIADLNVYVRDPIIAVFNEPVDPKSVNEGTVLVQSTWMPDPIAVDFSLSSDNLTLTIQMTQIPYAPGTLSVDLTGVRDRAGNTLGSDDSLWDFGLPEWYLNADGEHDEMFQSALGAHAAVTPDGVTYVAFSHTTFMSYHQAVVVRETDSKFEPVGDFPSTGNMDSDILDLASDSQGRILAVHSLLDWSTMQQSVEVLRFDAGTWTSLGAPDATGQPFNVGSEMKLAVGLDDTPIVAFQQFDGVDTNGYVATYTGGQWNVLGTLNYRALAPSVVYSLSPAVDADGNIGVAFVEFNGSIQLPILTVWNGTTWTPYVAVSYAYATSSGVRLAFDGTMPTLVWTEVTPTGDTDVFSCTFFYFNPPSWGYMTRPPLFVQAGAYAYLDGIGYDATGNLNVLFDESGPMASEAYWSRFTFDGWDTRSLGRFGGNTTAQATDLTFDPYGNAVVAMQEWLFNDPTVFVQTRNE